MVVAFHDASFGGQTNNGSQQGYVVAISTTKALEESRPMNAVDWSSSKIHRVVRSTLAAEAAAASHCHDRAVYARAMLSELDIKTIKESWTTEIKKIPCVQISDCRSLVDHCAKTGGSVSEKRVALDIADLRAAVEDGKTKVVWMPTLEMPADGLTKHLVNQKALRRLLNAEPFRVTYPKDASARKKSGKESQDVLFIDSVQCKTSMVAISARNSRGSNFTMAEEEPKREGPRTPKSSPPKRKAKAPVLEEEVSVHSKSEEPDYGRYRSNSSEDEERTPRRRGPRLILHSVSEKSEQASDEEQDKGDQNPTTKERGHLQPQKRRSVPCRASSTS